MVQKDEAVKASKGSHYNFGKKGIESIISISLAICIAAAFLTERNKGKSDYSRQKYQVPSIPGLNSKAGRSCDLYHLDL